MLALIGSYISIGGGKEEREFTVDGVRALWWLGTAGDVKGIPRGLRLRKNLVVRDLCLLRAFEEAVHPHRFLFFCFSIKFNLFPCKKKPQITNTDNYPWRFPSGTYTIHNISTIRSNSLENCVPALNRVKPWPYSALPILNWSLVCMVTSYSVRRGMACCELLWSNTWRISLPGRIFIVAIALAKEWNGGVYFCPCLSGQNWGCSVVPQPLFKKRTHIIKESRAGYLFHGPSPLFPSHIK